MDKNRIEGASTGRAGNVPRSPYPSRVQSVDSATVHGRRLRLPQEICSVSLLRLRQPRGGLTAGQKSAEGEEALRQVRGNKGSAGVDRMTVDQLGDYLKLAGYSGAIAERDLRTETGEAGGNPKAGWRRGAKAWHPNRAGSLCPASGDAGSAAAMEPDILLIQLWVPTAAVGASGRGSSAAVHRARLRMGDRPRSGKILRSSQSRQTDGPNRQARRGQTAVEAHPGISECRGDGERTGQPQRGRNSARRSAFATAK